MRSGQRGAGLDTPSSLLPGIDHLAARGPVWIAVPAGVLTGAGAMGTAAGLALLSLTGAVSHALIFAGAFGGFLALSMAMGVMLLGKRDKSFAPLVANTLSVGHALLFLSYAAGWAIGAIPAAARKALAAIPLPQKLEAIVAADAMMALNVAYVGVFALFTVLSATALIIFRYFSLTKI